MDKDDERISYKLVRFLVHGCLRSKWIWHQLFKIQSDTNTMLYHNTFGVSPTIVISTALSHRLGLINLNFEVLNVMPVLWIIIPFRVKQMTMHDQRHCICVKAVWWRAEMSNRTLQHHNAYWHRVSHSLCNLLFIFL